MIFSYFLEHPIVDLRTAKEYSTVHFSGAANFPLKSLESRLHELPSNQTPINLFGSVDSLKLATDLLVSKKYQVVETLVASDIVIEQLKQLAIGEQGNHSARLWLPASVVSWFVDQVSQKCIGLKGLDLACGAGRDSLFLAQNGWNMTAVDYSESALQKVEQYSVTGSAMKDSIKTKQIDLERNLDELSMLFSAFDAIFVVRYLHRELLQTIDKMLVIGGYIVYQTFLEGSEKFGSPKNPRFLLKPGELAEVFSSYKILLDDIEYLPDGLPTNRFIAQKIA